jgi:hypothetical protein
MAALELPNPVAHTFKTQWLKYWHIVIHKHLL